jgi:hypothetical protein
MRYLTTKLDAIHRLVFMTHRNMEKIMLNLDKLTAAQTALVAKVDGLTTVTAAVLENDKTQIALLKALSDEITAIKDGTADAETQAKLDGVADGIQTVSDTIAARSGDLAAATKNNTDAEDEPAAPTG